MATTTAFAYNPGYDKVPGTINVGLLAVGITEQDYSSNPGDLTWWNGPDQELGYVIAAQVPDNTQPTEIPGVNASVGFYGTTDFFDGSFIKLSEYFASVILNDPQSFSTPTDASAWLFSQGYWNSYDGLIMNWNIQNSASYPGTGSVITDLQGNINGIMEGKINYNSGSPSYLTIDGGSSVYINSGNLNPFLYQPNVGTYQSIFVWIYPTTDGVIFSEQGNTTPDSEWYDAQLQITGSEKYRFSFGVKPYSSGYSPIISGEISLNNWYYVGWTYDGTLRGYINGVKQGEIEIGRETPYNNGELPLLYNFGYQTTYNMGETPSVCTFNLGEVRIYNRGITEDEIIKYFNSSKSIYGY